MKCEIIFFGRALIIVRSFSEHVRMEYGLHYSKKVVLRNGKLM
jgi:hypothetical protein